MNKIRAIVTALALLALTPAIALAHTGSITATQDCETGNIVTAHLDDNVAASATWKVVINGTEVDSGTGPGPADLGPYDGGRDAGEAKLVIVFEQERNVYKTELKDVDPCPTPTPTATPEPTSTPTATTPPNEPTPTPTDTLPPLPSTDTATPSSGAWQQVLIVMAVITGVALVGSQLAIGRRR